MSARSDVTSGLPKCLHGIVGTCSACTIASLRALVAEKDKALKFYGDEANYSFDAKRDCGCGIGGGRDCYCSPILEVEEGELARVALALTEADMLKRLEVK